MDWFRMYHEFATDVKVQGMPEAMQRRLVMLFCFRCSNTLETLLEEEIAEALRIDMAALAETKALFIRKRFIDESWNLRQWGKRQCPSDTSTPRVAKHRAKMKELMAEEQARRDSAAALKRAEISSTTLNETPCNVAETPQIREEKNRRESNPLDAFASSESAGFALLPPPPVATEPPARVDIDPEFERAWAMFPARHGGNPKKPALAAWKARRAAGVEAGVMIAGLERYRVHIANSGKLGTQFVLQGATFFGPGERYLEPWPANGPNAARHLSIAGQDYSLTQRAMSESLARMPAAPSGEISFD